MKRTLSALAAMILTLGLTAAVNAGHPPVHQDDHKINNDNRWHDDLKIDHDHNKYTQSLVVHHEHKVRLLLADSRDFKYRRWLRRCHTYLFWSPSCDCWYYWYPPSDCYLPYDQIDEYPPTADVIPRTTDDLPPPVSGEDDGGPAGPPPSMPPADGPGH